MTKKKYRCSFFSLNTFVSWIMRPEGDPLDRRKLRKTLFHPSIQVFYPKGKQVLGLPNTEDKYFPAFKKATVGCMLS